MSIEAMKQAIKVLLNSRWEHYGCEDSWYSCPKHKDGCYNELAGDECNCGADQANLQIDLEIAALSQAIEQAERQESICPRCGATLVTPYGWQSVANPTEWLDELRGGADE